MGTGEGGSGPRRSLARPRRPARMATFPVLVLALALFCVEGLQVISSVVREDLASPPLVDVPPIDLRSAPSPARPTTVAGAVVAAESAPVTPAAAVVDPSDAAAPATAADSTAATTAVGGREGAVVETAAAPGATSDDPAGGAVTAASASPAPPAGPDGGPQLTAASASSDDRRGRRSASPRHRALGRSLVVPPGPPPGRPVGPDCDAKPGRRAACDRRPPID